MKKVTVIVLIAALLSACAGAQASSPVAPLATQAEVATLETSKRQQVGQISFENIEGYTAETDGRGGIFLGSPDAEISVMLMYVSNAELPERVIFQEFGASYVEEAIPLDIIIFLGFGNLQLGELKEFHFGEYRGYSRTFVGASVGNDPMEGEYLFFPLDENHTFIALGSVVRVTGENHWDPQGKRAFYTIMNSVQFN